MPGPTIMRLPPLHTLLWLRLRLKVALWRYRYYRWTARLARRFADWIGPPGR